MKLRHLRKFILITGTLLCVLIAAAFVVSAWWQIALKPPTSRGPALILMAGSVALFTGDFFFVPVFAEAHSYDLSRWKWWYRYHHYHQVLGARPSNATYRVIPLWLPFAAVAVLTLLVWRFWPKPAKPGHCRCGYNLTGNTSGKCPECGVEVQR